MWDFDQGSWFLILEFQGIQHNFVEFPGMKLCSLSWISTVKVKNEKFQGEGGGGKKSMPLNHPPPPPPFFFRNSPTFLHFTKFVSHHKQNKANLFSNKHGV